MKAYYQVFGFLGKSACRFLAYFQAIFRKVSENVYLHSTKHLETYFKLLLSCLNCPWKLKVKKLWEKSIEKSTSWQTIGEGGGGKYTSCPSPYPPHSPGIALKRHTFNKKHYLHKIYLHRMFILAYIRITKLLKKTISRSLLNNLVLQNCLHRLNIWGRGYYTKIN